MIIIQDKNNKKMSHPVRIFGYFIVVLLIESSLCEECSRIPLGIKSTPLPPDDRYYVKIENIGENYLPGQIYKVYLKSKYNATFIAFTISASGEERENEDNRRKPKILHPGVLRISPDENNAQEGCTNSIIQNHIMPKTSVQVTWQAPPKGNGCVTLHAYVAIKSEVYYNNQGPLSKRICEDTRKPEDMLPRVNADCQVCEDAKYKLTFEGLWSANTHHNLYPTSNTSLTQASFSEIVGASHNKDYTLFKSNDEASEGVKILAEQGNTTLLEVDMQALIGRQIRSIIKTNRPATTISTITAMFRVTKKHHLVSLVTAILPSPDWFLGASHFELCLADENRWHESVTLNLYPMDAGTDKGTDFNSANDNMMPPMPISPAFSRIKGPIKPFARIRFNLIRTYHLTPECFEKHEDEDEDGENGEGGSEDDNYGENEGLGEENEDTEEDKSRTTSSTTEAPVVTDPDSSADCPMTAWEEWTPCEGPCEGGRRSGAHSRYRYYLVDGVPFTEDSEKDVPQKCVEQYSDQESEFCEEDCVETTDAPVLSQQQVAPGSSWRDWFSFYR